MSLRDDPVVDAQWPTDLDDLERSLLTAISALEPSSAVLVAADAPMAPGSSLSVAGLDHVFDAQLASRHLDHAARWLRAQGAGFYTIGSAGHEANAVVAAAAAPDRPGAAALPVRRLLPGACPAGARPRRRRRRAARPAGVGRRADRRRSAQGVRPRRAGRHPADVDDRLAPAAGDGRGVRHRARPPARRCPRGGRPTPSPCARFGDASAQPLDGAGRAQRRGVHGAPGHRRCRCCSCARTTGGASACRRPAGWVEASFAGRPGLRYERVDGTDPVAVYDVDRGARRRTSAPPAAGRAAPAHGALTGPRRHRRRGGVPHGRRRSAPTAPATRCWRRPCSWSTPARATPTAIVDRVPRRPPARAPAGRSSWRAADAARPRPRSIAPLAPRRPAAGRRAAARAAAPASRGPRSSAACPRTRAR